MDNGTEEAKARREAQKQTGMEGRYERRKRSGLVGCLIIALSLVVLMIVLGSCTGIFYGDEQDESITEDQGSVMDDNGTSHMVLSSEHYSYQRATLEIKEATLEVASFISSNYDLTQFLFFNVFSVSMATCAMPSIPYGIASSLNLNDGL